MEKGGPAEKAGIDAGDVILRFDGKVVNSSEDLPRLVGATRPGSKVTVQVWRGKAARDLQMMVVEMTDDRTTR
ncbi:putative periplasmic serine endoprotease DegP-like precursor [compost metagenome]